MKQEIDKILDDIPSVVSKGFEDHKYILDCQFLPKLINAQDKVRSLDQQLKKELKQRDNKNDIKALQDQIDAYSKSISTMKEKESDYKRLLDDYQARIDEENQSLSHLKTELRLLNKVNLQKTY